MNKNYKIMRTCPDAMNEQAQYSITNSHDYTPYWYNDQQMILSPPDQKTDVKQKVLSEFVEQMIEEPWYM